MKTYLSFSILVLMSLLFIACSSTQVVWRLNYDVQCKNCGSTPDGYLNIQFNKSVGKDSSFTIIIKNMKN
jgi:hypothetical protein